VVNGLRAWPGPAGPSAAAVPPFARPHRRHNPLTDEWILVSAGRARRPWLGQQEHLSTQELPAYDPSCYLCPGNARVGGAANPLYDGTFVFINDFAALVSDADEASWQQGVLRAEERAGTCRVMCFSPRHDLTLARMSRTGIRSVIDLWTDQSAELGGHYRWVQVFENRGEAMGASNPHPHGQVWATTALPLEAAKEDAAQRRHWVATGRSLLLDYADGETGGSRVVDETEDFLVVVPFWAAWPFEAMVLPRRMIRRLPELTDDERTGLADMISRLLTRYDSMFDAPFPYTMGWHQAPFGNGDEGHWQLHAHVYPPLLRSGVRKFMVGYELLAESQRDLTPEEAAHRLREAATGGQPEAPGAA
jgi:UDPglucose--hexose-1-phosphate uridylyltransferase